MEMIVKIRAGYDIAFQCPKAVLMVLMLTTHPSRDGDILSDQLMRFSPGVEARDFFDPYGNICTRLVAPPGLLEVRSGLPDQVCPTARQWDVGELPGEALPFLLASRYCDTEELSPGPSLAASEAAGSERRRFPTMLMTAWSSATITRVVTAQHPKDTKNVAEYAGTSPIWQ